MSRAPVLAILCLSLLLLLPSARLAALPPFLAQALDGLASPQEGAAEDPRIREEFLALAQGIPWGRDSAVEGKLRDFRRRLRGTIWEHRAAYLLGRIAFQQERFPESIAYFARVARQSTLLTDYAEYTIARAFARQGLFEPAIRHLLGLRRRFPDSRLQARVLFSLGEAFAAAGARDRSVAAFEQVSREFPASDQTPLALQRLAAIYLERGATRRGAQRLLRLYLEFPLHGGDESALERLRELDAGLGEKLLPLPLSALLQRVERLEGKDAWPAAAAAWRAILARAEEEALRARASYRSAVAAKNSGQTRPAQEALEGFLERWPRHPQAPEATYLLAQLLWRRPTRQQAHQLFRRLERQYPTDPWAARALFALGQMAESGRQPRAAIVAYQEILDRFPRGPDRDRAAWRIGWLHYRDGRVQEAARVLAKQMAEGGTSQWDAAAAYWLGRTYERLGRRGEAVAAYRQLLERQPLSYYARTATLRLSSPQLRGAAPQAVLNHAADSEVLAPRQFLSETPFQESSLAFTNLPTPDTLRRSIRLARELALLQLPFDARAEVDHLATMLGADPAQRFLLGLLLYEAGATLEAFGVYASVRERLGEPARRALPREFWEAYFPATYRAEAAQAGGPWNLDDLLLLSLIRQESAFDAQARSQAGAIGLMQLLPSTGRTLQPRREGPLAADDLYDPALNIRLGTEYLGRLLRQFGNRLPLALAAYNAGPRTVQRWLAELGALPMEEFIESIPYRETQTYVKQVLRNYSIYQRLYGRGAPS
ncbi:MAG: transglycosylase SLT domain-containing protein [Candidatus Tectomicrobia bacterium]|nr:transglycosylase SLT domain-containing protein [Candidatus Tectomicrobia bacterium]